MLFAVDVESLTPFSEVHLTVRLVVGLLLTVVALSLALWRGNRILTVIRDGQPAVGRTDEKGVRVQAELENRVLARTAELADTNHALQRQAGPSGKSG